MTSEKSEIKSKKKTEIEVEDIFLESPKEEKEGLVLGNTSALFFPPPKLKFSKIRETVLIHFMEKECSKLKQELDKYCLGAEQITDFFCKEGRTLLSYSLIDASTDEPLKSLIELVPVQALQEVLSKDNFDVLESFLLGQVGLEEHQLYDKEREEAQIKKFKGLLSIDKDGVVNFMRENAEDAEIESKKVKANFDRALVEYAAENTSSKKLSNES